MYFILFIQKLCCSIRRASHGFDILDTNEVAYSLIDHHGFSMKHFVSYSVINDVIGIIHLQVHTNKLYFLHEKHQMDMICFLDSKGGHFFSL
ncbi:hypothetical protein [Pseudomonas phage vB_Pa-PAC2]